MIGVLTSTDSAIGGPTSTMAFIDHLAIPVRDLAAKIRVPFPARETRQQGDVGHPGDRRGAHAGVFVPHRQLLDRPPVLRIVGDLGNGRGADRRIGMLPSWLRFESVEERHRKPYNPRTSVGKLRRW